jgi:hypothetical protein
MATIGRMRHVACAAAIGVALSGVSIAQAAVYKWVDNQGRTHYGERKPGSAGGKPSTIEIHRSPEVPPAPRRTEPLWPESSKAAAPPPTPVASRHPAPVSDGKDHGTDASRCALARDILSGALVLSNGKPTGELERSVARSDIQLFCRKSR